MRSNWQDFKPQALNHTEAKSAFTVHCEVSTETMLANPTCIQAIGAFDALTDADVSALREMLENRAPRSAIVTKAAAVVERVAQHHRSAATVGRRLNTACIPHEAPDSAASGYVTDGVEHSIPLINTVKILGENYLKVRAVELRSAEPLAGPKLHRNALCWCGKNPSSAPTSVARGDPVAPALISAASLASRLPSGCERRRLDAPAVRALRPHCAVVKP